MLRPMTSDDVAQVLELERRLFPHDAWPKHLFQDELAQAEPAVPTDRATRRYWVVEAPAADAVMEEPAALGTAGPDDPGLDVPGPEDTEPAVSHREGRRIIGYAGMMCVAPIADVQTLAVAPEAQGSGLGTRLLRTIVEAARTWPGITGGAEQVLLEVRADNPGAQALYQREGFSHIHTRAQYYPDGEDALIMQRLLKDQVR